ncbi:hypothetical protein JAAARDRAFT_59574 [Jaapia argillacea MUCL 33604]|uniref:Uncharacterized protein n=1 Tax=Jaapia argillacea MUCL 33604 TaxID=933084 RepID=A0A067PN22_9AGAM|nr:hypothetical protein JAAARDRAFT_59574 [Jaapia argillacea MUCL 33604]
MTSATDLLNLPFGNTSTAPAGAELIAIPDVKIDPAVYSQVVELHEWPEDFRGILDEFKAKLETVTAANSPANSLDVVVNVLQTLLQKEVEELHTLGVDLPYKITLRISSNRLTSYVSRQRSHRTWCRGRMNLGLQRRHSKNVWNRSSHGRSEGIVKRPTLV